MLNPIRITLLTLLLSVGISYADNTSHDSIRNIISTTQGQKKVDLLNEISLDYCYSEPAFAKQLIFECIKLADDEKYAEGCGKAYLRLGIAYDVTGQYDSAVYCYKYALTKYKSPKGLGSAYNNLGLIEWKHAKLKEAANYFYKALPYFRQLDDKSFLANLYNNLGLIFYETSEMKKTLSFQLQALQIYKDINDMEHIGATCTNLCNAYHDLKNYDSSEYFIKESIKYSTKANDQYGLSIAYIDYATILSSYPYKEYDKALDYFSKALQSKKEMNEEEGIAHIYINMSHVYKQKGDWESFLKYNRMALELSKKNAFLLRQQTIYHNLADYFSYKKNTDSVVFYLKSYDAIKDSVFNREFKSSLSDAETKYQTKEKELTIKTQEYRLSKQNYYIIALCLSIITIGLIFFFVYYRNKQNQKLKLKEEIIKQQDMAARAILEAEDNERRRIAGDLHDSVGQILSAVKINLSSLQPDIQHENHTRYENIMNMVDGACKEVRAISHNMMPNSLLRSGLVAAIKEFISQIDSDVLKVRLDTTGLNQRLDHNTEMVLYRVIQECVNNVIKHAQAKTLEIQIIKDQEGISVMIEDDGIGFDPGQQKDGIGLANLKTRIDFLKGQLDIQSALGKGTLVAIFVGVKPEA
jgi:two-component system NarL family sensor kinase